MEAVSLPKGKYKKEIKKLDKAISFYIDKTNKSKEEVSYLHELLHKRHDCMLLEFYEKRQYQKFIPKNIKVIDILFNKPFFANKYVKSMDDSAPDAFILLEDPQGNKSVVVHELKCGRSKRMISKGIAQLDKYAREVSKTFSEIACLLTYGKRTKLVELQEIKGLQHIPNSISLAQHAS